jgi:transposase
MVTIGIDLGKNIFHLIGLDERGTIVMRQRKTRSQMVKSLANMAPCLVGMEAFSGAHHLGRTLEKLGHRVRLMPAQYVKPYLKGHKNDYRDAAAIAEAVQRTSMRFVPLKSADQLDLQALHRVRSRLVTQRTAVINQIRGFLLERGIPVRQGAVALRVALPEILSTQTEALSAQVARLIEDLCEDWRRLDNRVAAMTTEIEALVEQSGQCRRLMSTPGVGPITSSAMIAAQSQHGQRRVPRCPQRPRSERERRADAGARQDRTLIRPGGALWPSSNNVWPPWVWNYPSL